MLPHLVKETGAGPCGRYTGRSRERALDALPLGSEEVPLRRLDRSAAGLFRWSQLAEFSTAQGGPAVVNPCEGELPSVGGKGGDGLPGGAEDGHDGEPTPTPNRYGPVAWVTVQTGSLGRTWTDRELR